MHAISPQWNMEVSSVLIIPYDKWEGKFGSWIIWRAFMGKFDQSIYLAQRREGWGQMWILQDDLFYFSLFRIWGELKTMWCFFQCFWSDFFIIIASLPWMSHWKPSKMGERKYFLIISMPFHHDMSGIYERPGDCVVKTCCSFQL